MESLFVIEGPNGAGKSEVVKILASHGHNTFECPGATPISKMLRPLCRGEKPYEDIDPFIQMLLFGAARTDEYLRLVHNSGKKFIVGRWWTSTYVYQQCHAGLSLEAFEATIDNREKIGAVIILMASVNTLLKRVMFERELNPKHGFCTWTRDGKDTLTMIRSIYLHVLPAYLKQRGIRSIIIDTEILPVNEVANLVEKEVMGNGISME
jgi:thymidylate kinase